MSNKEDFSISVKSITGRITWRTVTFLVILLWACYLVYQARDWAINDRLFPYLVGSVLIILILLQLLKSSGLLSRVSPDNLLTEEVDNASALMSDEGTEEPSEQAGMDLLPMVAWILVFPILIYYVGYLLATPVYLFAFLLYVLRDLKQTVLYGIVIMVALYLVFYLGFDIDFWQGALLRG